MQNFSQHTWTTAGIILIWQHQYGMCLYECSYRCSAVIRKLIYKFSHRLEKVDNDYMSCILSSRLYFQSWIRVNWYNYTHGPTIRVHITCFVSVSMYGTCSCNLERISYVINFFSYGPLYFNVYRSVWNKVFSSNSTQIAEQN